MCTFNFIDLLYLTNETYIYIIIYTIKNVILLPLITRIEHVHGFLKVTSIPTYCNIGLPFAETNKKHELQK